MPSLAILLNGTSTAVQVSVNNGGLFSIVGTDAGRNLAAPTTNAQPVSFNQGGTIRFPLTIAKEVA